MDNYYKSLLRQRNNFYKKLSQYNCEIAETCPVCGGVMSFHIKDKVKNKNVETFFHSFYHKDFVCYNCLLDDFIPLKDDFIKIMNDSIFYYTNGPLGIKYEFNFIKNKTFSEENSFLKEISAFLIGG